VRESAEEHVLKKKRSQSTFLWNILEELWLVYIARAHRELSLRAATPNDK